MVGNMHEITEEFPYELIGNVSTPTAPHLFDKDEHGTPLNTNDSCRSESVMGSHKSAS
jgi:hypothetical protein